MTFTDDRLTYTSGVPADITLVSLNPKHDALLALRGNPFFSINIQSIKRWSADAVQALVYQKKETNKTDHCPEVVGHLLSVLKDSPEEEIPPRMLAELLHLWEVLLALEKPTFRWFLLYKTFTGT